MLKDNTNFYGSQSLTEFLTFQAILWVTLMIVFGYKYIKSIIQDIKDIKIKL